MTIKKIIHIADLHVRNYKRHKEYLKVFKTAFDKILQIKDENTVIFLGGDIVHSKTEMTPELVSLVSYFLKSCADICPTILILGNHDANLKNEHRLDALSPIVKTLNHPNLHYWKDSGVYEFGNINFSVFSVLGAPSEWVLAKDISSDKLKIALHHGAVYGSKTDLDHVINNEFVKVDLFDGFDYVLLGDIHKRQFLNESNSIHYPGSLIQQDHAEDLIKGFTVWNFNDHTSEFIRVPNEIGYVTVLCKNNTILTPQPYIKSWPHNIRLRIKHENCTKEYINSLVTKIKEKYHVEEISTPKINSQQAIVNKESILEDVRDIEFQNKLITEYIESRNLHHADVDYIRHINRNINSELNSMTKLIRNVHWSPKKIEFSNMFSYGPNNFINFESLRGIQGVFAKNASGKSSMLDVLTYCIYDKCSRAWKGKDVLNNRKDKFKCKLFLELNGEEYVIERSGFKNKKTGAVRVEVDFYKINLDGSKQILNGEDRDQTNKQIRDLLGTYDDFLLTTLSAQIDNKNFILKSQRERKELLYSFLDLSVFEQLNTIAKTYIKSKSNELSNIDLQLSSDKFLGLEQKIADGENKLTSIQNKISELTISKKELDLELNLCNKNLIPIPNENCDWSQADSERFSELPTIIEELKNKRDNTTSYISTLESNRKHYSDIETVKTNFKLKSDDASNLTQEIQSLSSKLSLTEQTILTINNTIERLNDHKYDPNCKYCTDNVFVKDALIAKQTLPEHLKTKDSLQTQLNKLTAELNQLNSEANILWDLIEDCNKLESQLSLLNSELSNILKDIIKYESEYLTLSNAKQTYDNYHSSIEHNKILNQNINELRAKILKLESELKLQTDLLLVVNADLKFCKMTAQEKIELTSKFNSLIKEVSAYNIYIDMTHNDGLPYMILSKILPVIENEVNLILSDIVDFYVKFESDEKFNINCYLYYNNDASWPVEMASGMERFILSLAIRCSLVEITSLPRPIFMAIDEGFGSLDSDKVNSLYSLFDYMRTKFDFVIAVSHIDTMKDMVDGLIDITKTADGFSEVYVA